MPYHFVEAELVRIIIERYIFTDKPVIGFFCRAVLLNQGRELPWILRDIGEVYAQTGISEKEKYYIQQAFDIDGDYVEYYSALSNFEMDKSNYEAALGMQMQAYHSDSGHVWNLFSLGNSHLMLGDYGESPRYMEKYISKLDLFGIPCLNDSNRIAYV